MMAPLFERSGLVRSVCAAAAASMCILLGGCATEIAPRFEVLGAEVVERSDRAAVVLISVEGRNSNEFELPLREVEYWVEIDGRGAFRGTREAQATLPRFGSQRFELPAAVMLAELSGNDDAGDEPWGDSPVLAGREATIRGTVTYESAGSIAELLFDAKLRVPRAGFVGREVIAPLAAGAAARDEAAAGGG